MKVLLLSIALTISSFCFAQHQTDSGYVPKVILVPFQNMMYFSDADLDIARISKTDPDKIRQKIRLETENNCYHQLLSQFEVISLLRANTTNGEADLNRIYAATRYTVFSNFDQETYHKQTATALTLQLKKITERFKKQNKEQTFWTNDSAVMLADIGDRDLFAFLNKKYNNDYVLFITQFEINTSNKNTLEWLKQEYNREYTIHYNLFDKNGVLIRAETLTLKAGNENKIDDIKSKYLISLAQKMKEILMVASKNNTVSK